MEALIQRLTIKPVLIISGILISFLMLGLLVQYVKIASLKADKATVEADLKVANGNVATQNILIASQKADFESKLKEAKKVSEKIHTRYVTTYTNIDSFKGDSNATDCENASAFLDTIKY
ncbi:MAG: hypothetical protein JHC33_09610 [Ignisphaera sp.]|nr:hypothetical protein [Ignisphaera sp.]